MPPKTEDMHLALVHGGDEDYNCMPSSPCSSTVSVSSGLKRQDSCCFSFVELQQQPNLLSEENVAEAFETSLGYLSLRVEDLSARTLEAVQSLEHQQDDSPVLKACTMSLHLRVPLLLKQATLLIRQLKQQQSSSDDSNVSNIIIGRLRCNFALVRLVQYLDLIESAMQNPPRELLDERLLEILSKFNIAVGRSNTTNNFDDEEQQTYFRVSPWLAKSLAFDLPIGQSASTQILHGSLPLQVEVEPILEIHAADIVDGKLENLCIGACSVVIQSCKHKATPFSTGAGMIGECIIRVHLTPLFVNDDDKKKQQQPAARLIIKEARAVQVNAYPPKPKANVDLYTSHLHGDAGITVTMIVKTSVTETVDEIPKLHIELFLAPLLLSVHNKNNNKRSM